MATPAQAFVQTINSSFKDIFRFPQGQTVAQALANQNQAQLFVNRVGSAANNWTSKPAYGVLGGWTEGKLPQGRRFSARAMGIKIRPVNPATATEAIIGDIQYAAKLIGIAWAPELGILQTLGSIEDWPGVDPYQNSTSVVNTITNPRTYFGFGVPDITVIRHFVEPLIWVGQDNPSSMFLTNLSNGDAWTPTHDLEIIPWLGGTFESVVANQ